MSEYLKLQKADGQKTVDKLTELKTLNNKMIKSQTEVEEEDTFRLIEERLIADHKKSKVGEVIIRKEIETQIIQVPVRREKLIVEQVSPENKRLAEIDLTQGEISGLEFIDDDGPLGTVLNTHVNVSGEFSSPKIASLLLNAIAQEKNHGCEQVKITIAVTNESLQKKYQEWFARCSKGEKPLGAK
jgi:hypothetical protein